MKEIAEQSETGSATTIISGLAVGMKSTAIPILLICVCLLYTSEYRHHSPNKLSGGQKQRVAIAGVVAMEPKCIVMDEPTAMLDPVGRREVLKTVHKLRKQKKVTLILITHYREEVVDADKIFVMDHGKVCLLYTSLRSTFDAGRKDQH